MINVFEWLFPSAPKEEPEQQVEKVESNAIEGDISTLKMKSDIAHRGYQEEFERMRATEGKASIFISTTGFLATIVVGVTTLLVRVEQIDLFVLLLVAITGFLTFYMMRTIVYSVRAMRRQNFLRINPASVASIADETAQLKECIADYINAVKLNMQVINRKVELSSMAQTYFKRAIAALVVYVVALFMYALVNSNIPIGDYYTTVSTEISQWTLPVWYMYSTLILIVISLVLSCIALYKVSKMDAKSNEE